MIDPNDIDKLEGKRHRWQINYNKGEYERVRELTEQEL